MFDRSILTIPPAPLGGRSAPFGGISEASPRSLIAAGLGRALARAAHSGMLRIPALDDPS